MERFSKRKSLVEKIIGFAFLSSYLLLRIKLNSLHRILEWFLDKFDPALKMKFLHQVLSPVKRASGEEIVGEELEKNWRRKRRMKPSVSKRETSTGCARCLQQRDNDNARGKSWEFREGREFPSAPDWTLVDVEKRGDPGWFNKGGTRKVSRNIPLSFISNVRNSWRTRPRLLVMSF